MAPRVWAEQLERHCFQQMKQGGLRGGAGLEGRIRSGGPDVSHLRCPLDIQGHVR